MYKALIVDDEIYAVMGIKSGVDWQALQITEVYEAYNMRDALNVFERTPIDVMVCDIEMPKGTGIQLLERVNEISPETETIFLTAHSAFDFMKRAIQLDGFDYLLKPIEFDVLQETISKALHSIEQERELNSLRELYKPYYEMWNRKKTLITEKFWNDVLSGRIVCKPDNVKKILEEHELAGLEEAFFLPVLVSVESWLREFSTRDEEMIEYAIRKGAAEMLLSAAGSGEVIQTKQGVNVVIFYEFGEERVARDQLLSRCEEYIQSCKKYFSCSVSCYIGESSTLYDIADTYRQLLEHEYKNLQKTNRVEAFVPVRGRTNTVELLQNDSVIQRVQDYIMEHLSEPITREELARHVHLNPAYLSRLFKRKAGQSITDYILYVRMSQAKDLIATSTLPISDVAKTFGYYNFSHFSKMFRKVYHVSPQQYRQQSVSCE